MKYTPSDPCFEKKVRDSFLRQKFMTTIGAQLVSIEPGICEIHLPYKPGLSQQHGFFHAGVIGTIADNCAGYAAFSLMDADSSVLSVEYKLNLLAPGDGEMLIGQGKVIKPGRTLTICRSTIYVVKNNTKKRCADALLTMMQMKGKLDEPHRPPT
ncbi:MAG: PaaI family thioesterase [Desulfobacteraceae bacterium]|nr:PaaI family thioesterase [Desulfobacteraceae bacterium]